MKALSRLLPLAMPLIIRWVRAEERFILREGRPLDEPAISDARRMGVATPEKIRLMPFEGIPARHGRIIYRIGKRVGWFPEIAGITLGHGIYLRKTRMADRKLIAHECVHVGQYERMGTAGFLCAYLTECLLLGYCESPLEREACERAEEI